MFSTLFENSTLNYGDFSPFFPDVFKVVCCRFVACRKRLNISANGHARFHLISGNCNIYNFKWFLLLFQIFFFGIKNLDQMELDPFFNRISLRVKSQLLVLLLITFGHCGLYYWTSSLQWSDLCSNKKGASLRFNSMQLCKVWQFRVL